MFFFFLAKNKNPVVIKGEVQPGLIQLGFSYESQECNSFFTPVTRFQQRAV